MLDASSHGRATPKAKTINVEANLLAERLAERARLREAAGRKLLILIGVLLASAVALPGLHRFKIQTATMRASSERKEIGLSAQLTTIEKRQETAKPVLADRALLDKVVANSTNFVGQITAFFNVANPDMAFSTVKSTADLGTLTIDAKADCKDYSTAKDFVAENSKTPAARDVVLLNVRRTAVLGPNSVSVDLSKKVALQP